MYFFGVDYTTTVTGSIIRLVRCEQCNYEYAYQMNRKIKGRALSPYAVNTNQAAALSERRAQKRLEYALRNSCDPVPCPACGWYQRDMIQRLKKLRLRWIPKLAIAMIPLSVFVFVIVFSLLFNTAIPKEHHPVIAGLAVAGAWCVVGMLLLGRIILNQIYDPNSTSFDYRIAKGKAGALSKEQYQPLTTQASSGIVDSSFEIL